MREVDGWTFDSIRHFETTRSPDVPQIIPEIYHAARRADLLRVRAVAIPLRILLGRAAMQCNFETRHALFQHLKVSSRSALIIDCIGRDRLIESFWAHRNTLKLVDAIARLRPTWLVAPNYSVITDVPRWENLHAMKRSLIVWSEFTARGVPSALTLNARTDWDWERWTEFAMFRPELKAVAVEFATGARHAERRNFMLMRLRALGIATQGRLRLFMRGGRSQRPFLASAFSQIHVLDTNSFMKSVHRQRVTRKDDRIGSARSFSLLNQPIETLLQSNIRMSR